MAPKRWTAVIPEYQTTGRVRPKPTLVDRRPDGKECPRLCENAQEPARRRIVFSITLLPIAVTALFVFRLTKSRRTFYAQIECLCFHTVWPPSGRCRRHRAVAMSDGKQTFVERLPSEGNASGAACNKARPNRCSIRPTAQLTPDCVKPSASSRTALLDNDIFRDASGN